MIILDATEIDDPVTRDEADADVWGEGVKPHGRDCPDRCSQCIGAPVQRITIDGAELLIDGKPAGRELDKEQGVQTYYQRRGGKR